MSVTEQVQIMEHGLFDTQSRTMIKAYDLFNNYGGCSFYWRDGMMAMITNGYMVGGASKSITVASDQIDMRLFSYMWDYFTDKFSALSDDDELCLGLWKDPSNGAIVMNSPCKESALTMVSLFRLFEFDSLQRLTCLRWRPLKVVPVSFMCIVRFICANVQKRMHTSQPQNC